MIRRFARPYARAIMDIVKSPDAASKLRDELAGFESVRRSSGDLQDLYANPGFEPEAKIKVSAEIARRLGLSDLAVKVIGLLIRNHRINDLASIVAALSAMIRTATNTVAAEVRAAHQPTPAEIESLRKTLESKFGQKVEIDVTVDPTLLGGFVARVGSEIYDASVVGKIDKFRASLS